MAVDDDPTLALKAWAAVMFGGLWIGAGLVFAGVKLLERLGLIEALSDD